MKKKICFLTCILCFTLCGCGKNDIFDKLDKSSDSEVMPSETGESAKYFKGKNIKCDVLKDVSILYKNYFWVENNGKYDLYEYNLLKKYDNDQNCNLIEENTSYSSLLGCPKDKSLVTAVSFTNTRSFNYYIGGNPISVYTYTFLGNENNNNYYYEYKYFFAISKYTKESNDRIHQFNEYSNIVESTVPIYMVNDKYASLDENKQNLISVYLKSLGSRVYEATSEDEILFSVQDDDEYIEKIFNDVIITNKNVYFYGITDYSCNEYINKSCSEGFKVNRDLTSRVSDIAFMNDLYIVFTDGRTYLYNDL